MVMKLCTFVPNVHLLTHVLLVRQPNLHGLLKVILVSAPLLGNITSTVTACILLITFTTYYIAPVPLGRATTNHVQFNDRV